MILRVVLAFCLSVSKSTSNSLNISLNITEAWSIDLVDANSKRLFRIRSFISLTALLVKVTARIWLNEWLVERTVLRYSFVRVKVFPEPAEALYILKGCPDTIFVCKLHNLYLFLTIFWLKESVKKCKFEQHYF